MRKITYKRFCVYVKFTRDPMVSKLSEEVQWYENTNCTIWGTILFDLIDSDYAAVLLARDENHQIRAIDVSASFENIDDAEQWIFKSVAQLEQDGKTVFPQGMSQKGIDLFLPVVAESKQNPIFNILNTQLSYSSAKNLISEITPHFYDIDGNFIEQFQTQGFDSRLWELYLFCYFNEEELVINREHEAPDFLLSNDTIEVGVEAVIIGRREAPVLTDPMKLKNIDIPKELSDKMPIMYGSPLYSKLKHTNSKGLHYWEYTHIKNKPFVLAIADFHEDFAMTWTTTALITYLYGYKHNYHYDGKGKLIIVPQKIEQHVCDKKTIPSGFFRQPDSENISAILHSTSGTLSKFNRIGKECGFDEGNITMIRNVTYHNWDPNADKPQLKQYIVGEKSDETWAEGVAIFHNPNAKVPLPSDFFPNAAQYFFNDGQITSIMPDFFPYASVTMVIQETDEQ